MKAKRYRSLVSMINDPQRKDFLNIIIESFHCAIIEKEMPYCYFTNLLYKKVGVAMKTISGSSVCVG